MLRKANLRGLLLLVIPFLSFISSVVFADDNLTPLVSITRDELLARSIDVLDEPVAIAAHPAGNFVYVAERGGDSVSVYKVSETKLVHVQTLREGEPGIDRLEGVVDVEITADGRHLYVASIYDDAVTFFAVDQKSGKLALRKSYVSGARDAAGTLIEGMTHFLNAGINDIALSPANGFLALSNSWSGGAVFRRDPTTGELSFRQRAYPGYSSGNSQVTFGRNDQELILLNSLYDDVVFYTVSATGTTTRSQLFDNNRNGVTGLDGPVGALFRNNVLYVTSSASDTISVFTRPSGTTYAKTQEIALGAREPSGELLAMRDPGNMAVGLDGQFLHVSSRNADAIATFTINPANGTLTPVAQTTSLTGTLDGVNSLKAIPGSPWLLASMADGDRLQLFSERLRYPKHSLRIIQPLQDAISIVEGTSIELKAYAWHLVNGDISKEIKWYDQTGALLGSGRTITLRNRAVGVHTILAQYKVTGLKLEDRLRLTVVDSGNGAPVIISQPPLLGSVGVVYEYRLEAIDDSPVDQLRFSLVTGPQGMTVSADGFVSWTPSESQIGLQPVVIRVTDQNGAFTEQSFGIDVENTIVGNSIHFTSTPLVDGAVGNPYRYDADAISGQGLALKYYIQVSPEGMTIDEQTGVITWIPQGNDVGVNPVSIRAMDNLGNSADQAFTISVPLGMLPPEIVSTPDFNAAKNREYMYALGVEPGEGEYSYGVTSSAQGASISQDGILRWQPDNAYLETLSNDNKYCGIPVPELGSFDPVLKWHWDDAQTRNSPLVAQFSDDNGDGEINYLDHPDVAFIAYTGTRFDYAWIEVLDGATGEPLSSFVRPAELFDAYGQIAIGDINNDGQVEIVGTTIEKVLVAYSVQGGTPLWRKPMPAAVSLRNHVGFYDLDGDGRTEILAGKGVFESDGDLKWVLDGEDVASGGTYEFGTPKLPPYEDQLSYAAELDANSAGLEVVLGHQVYSAAGVRLWQGEGSTSNTTSLQYNTGFSAVADLENDGEPELIVVSNGLPDITAYEMGGKRIWTYRSTGASAGGPPTVGDLDGDGFVEIAFVRNRFITVMNHDGSVLWQAPIQETSSGVTGSTIFDFEGDGEAELLYGDEQFLRVYDKTGAVKYQVPNISGTWTEYPVIADINNDGHADIVMPSSDSRVVDGAENTTRGVRVFSDANNSWAGTRSIWNQHAYHIDNINDDGSIPAHFEPNYRSHNTFRVSTYKGASGLQLIDMAPVDLRLQEQQGAYHLLVDVLNRSSRQMYSPFTVQVYHGDPGAGALIGQRQIEGAQANQQIVVDLGEVTPAVWSEDITVVVALDEQVQECNTVNNTLRAAYFAVTATDTMIRSDSQYFLVSVSEFNDPPEIISVPPVTTLPAATAWTYRVVALDGDLGDSLHYALAEAPSGMKVDQFTGLINWRPSVADEGNHQVRIVVSDVSGNVDEQIFTLTVEHNADVNNPPIFDLRSEYEVLRGTTFSLIPPVRDAEGSVASIELVSIPAGVNIDTATNQITWRPVAAGRYEFVLRATDDQGMSALGTFTLWVTSIATSDGDNVAPPETVVAPNVLVFLVGQANSYALPPPDNGVGYTYRLVGSYSGVIVHNNLLSWTPTATQLGRHSLTVEMTNGTFTYRYPLEIDVRATANRPPDVVTAGFPGTLHVNETLQYTFAVTDPDNDEVSFRITDMPAGMTLAGRTVTWTPSSEDVGPHSLSLEINDGVSYIVTADLAFNVRLLRNRPPQLTLFDAPDFAAIGHSYSYHFSAVDPDRDQLTFVVENAPPGMVMSPNGTLTMNTIPASAAGTYNTRVLALDGNGGSAWVNLVIRVGENQPPRINNQPATAAYVGKPYTYSVRVTDPENMGASSYALAGGPQGMTLNSNGDVRWVPTAEQVGSHPVSIVVTDILGDSSTIDFTLTVYTDQVMYRRVCAAEIQ